MSTYGLMWSLGEGAPPFGSAAAGLSLWEMVDLAGDWKLDTVQFADNRPLDALPVPERRRLVNRVHDTGMTIEIAVRGADPEHLLTQLRLAKESGAALLRTVLGTPGIPPITADTAIANLAPLQPEFERAGIPLALENYDHLPTAELARISRTLGPWTGICLDTVNSSEPWKAPQPSSRLSLTSR